MDCGPRRAWCVGGKEPGRECKQRCPRFGYLSEDRQGSGIPPLRHRGEHDPRFAPGLHLLAFVIDSRQGGGEGTTWRDRFGIKASNLPRRWSRSPAGTSEVFLAKTLDPGRAW